MKNPLWKPVVGFENFYEISSDGRVRRIAPFMRGRGCKDEIPRELKLTLDPTRFGYFRVSLIGEPGARREHHSVHRLVASAFIGPCPAGMEVNHIDRVRTNNDVRNLEYVTRLGNAAHKASFLDAYDRLPRGTKHHNSKLDAEKVREIRNRLLTGDSMESIGSAYGVTGATVAQIRDGKTWRTV